MAQVFVHAKVNWTLFRLAGSYSVRLYAPPATSRSTRPIARAAASDLRSLQQRYVGLRDD